MYQAAAKRHFKKYRQMLFISGPRQVGKTTVGRLFGEERDDFRYFSWDNDRHKELIVQGPDAVAAAARVGQERPPLVMFDEIHRYSHWKRFLKGFYDTYPGVVQVIVTGSARLDVYQRGGDSLMGRYFLHRMHPLSVGEIVDPESTPTGLRPEPSQITPEAFETLWRFGGFPEPYLQAEDEFYHAWRRLKKRQLFQEDLRELSRLQQVSQVELLAELLRRQAGQLTSYTSLANKVRITANTARSWLKVLGSLYYCFGIRPWSKNVSRSLLKEPKYYLYDWSLVDDEAAKAENMVASHLLKSVDFWNDTGAGDFDLFFLRDKDKREVDFVVTRGDKPWFLVEVKLSDSTKVSSSLRYFQRQLQAPHAIQVVFDLPYENLSAFSGSEPLIVPAQTFLSQLV